MNARLFRAKRQGQSLPLIALIIVVLFGMVALSVDVGNTYAQNRNAVRATNAAALAGMDKLIHNGSDGTVAASIQASFKSNGITAQLDPRVPLESGDRRVIANYLDAGGNPLGGGCYVGQCGGVPPNVAYIQVRTEGTVDTYFARVVGRDTLPVKAQAFAAQCSPVKGVYPIAVNAKDLDLNAGKFLPPTVQSEMSYYGLYADPQYPDGLSARRIYNKTNFNVPGSFSWLQWTAPANGGSAVNTEDMLANDGNLDLKFQEVVPWPDANQPAPTGYPLLPGQLSEGDWIYGNSGVSASSGIKTALDFHVANRTVMYLPIISDSLATSGSGGQNARFHVLKLGAFYLRGYSLTGQGYFDLVYIGEAEKTACLNTNVNLGLKGLGLTGQVYVNPRWKANLAGSQPIAYQIVLDVSGSMSWDFNGYGTFHGGDVQCESPNNPNPLNLEYASGCQGGVDSAWRKEGERRITVAKNAIYNFIDGMGEYDMMRVVAFTTGSNNRAKLETPGTWSTNKGQLKNYVKNVGMYQNDPYRTSGGTAGADALDQASKFFLTSQGFVPVEPTTGLEYKPVVIYLTDGVANIFLDGTVNTARDIPLCAAMSQSQAINTASPCQVGYTANNVARPITAMIYIANGMKARNDSLGIYVVAMAQTPPDGLERVANSDEYFFPAEQAAKVQETLKKIQDAAEQSTCNPAGGYSWVNSITGSAVPGSPPAPGSSVFGQVFIYEPGKPTPKYTLPIDMSSGLSQNGQLGFSIAPPDPSNPASQGITPGNYEMAAYIWYKGTDGVARSYDYFVDQSTLVPSNRITFSVSSGATIGSSVALAPIFLDLDPAKVVCPPTP
jgi:hypothetical protein